MMNGYELPLVFVSGVLGSAHCIGMCGAISATMNLGTSRLRSACARQLIWSTGRTFTYAFLGMLAAFAGERLSESAFARSQAEVVSIQAVFAIVAGLALIIQGLISAGVFRRSVRPQQGCLTASVLGRFVQGGSATGTFIAGIATGFLPCGLVYTFLALAAASGSVWQGPLIMTTFGLGTMPVMLLTGAGFSLASLSLRQRLMRVAAVCVVITGLLTAGRGIAFAFPDRTDGQSVQDSCPFCSTSAETTETAP
ncbi:MAG: sulfite exporter TauE/SafE family protein [Planctomycetaceae bacterium]|nr:sulfite exporter TauE/SafE family protein [Planctomycetaceae bacterium]